MPSRSSAPDELAPLLQEILARLRASGENAPLVVIDGRSGAGKSTLAGLLHERLPDGADLLALDSLYPGWDGLAAASAMIAADVVVPRAAGGNGRWRRWDWDADRPAEEHLILPARPLIVEGSGALTAPTAAHATVSVWMDASASQRRERALARDGDAYAPHWERWAAQEDRHIQRNDPASLADIVYDASAARTSASSR